MSVTRQQTLCKAERLNGKKQVDSLFMGGTGCAMSIYPIRMIYAIGQCDAASREPQAKIMVSVPKRYFKREAYRRNKHLLLDMLAQHPGTQVLIAFIWTSDELSDSAGIESRMKKLLARLGEKTTASLCHDSAN